MSERIVDPSLSGVEGEESAAELALRPKSLDEFIGQHRVRDQLTVLLQAAKSRGASADHILLSGPPGLGSRDGRTNSNHKRACDNTRRRPRSDSFVVGRG